MDALLRLVIADDHWILRDGLRRLLEAEPGFQVVGEASSAAQARQLGRELAPDILLLDFAMPDGTGLDVLRDLSEARLPTRVILLTAAIEKQQVVEALLLGARGVVLKEAATSMLFRAIRAVIAGEYWLGHDRVPDIIDALRRYGGPQPPTPADTLSPRELTIVAAVVGGSTNREISEQLGISEQTVKNHMSNIFDKMGVSNRLELALFAIHHKVLERRRAEAGKRGAGSQEPSARDALLAPGNRDGAAERE